MNAFSDPPATALDWLYSAQLYGIKLGLDNVHRLLNALGLPASDQKFLHVAGTNGKGSTCAFLHAMLKEDGRRVGLFTSPHLLRFNERIRDQEREIRDDEIEEGLTRLRELTADWQLHPTFFELTLALALDWFRHRDVEWVILETGLGGRLDATNALLPEVSVITRIGLDHCEQLGSTLTDIAREKAGIIKPGVPVVSVPQAPEVQQVIEQAARDQQAPLTWVEEPLQNIPLGLAGAHQTWNAALAVETLRSAQLRLPAMIQEAGLRNVVWPARFQVLENGRLIVDGAHNADSAEALARTWQAEYPGELATIVLGGSTGKELTDVLRPLAPLAASWILTPFNSPRSVPTTDLRAVLKTVQSRADWQEADHVEDALERARQQPERILVVGSLFLAGELLALLRGQSTRPTQQ